MLNSFRAHQMEIVRYFRKNKKIRTTIASWKQKEYNWLRKKMRQSKRKTGQEKKREWKGDTEKNTM